MSGSVGSYLTQVDRLLAAGQSLFATPATAHSLKAMGRPLTPAPPSASGLSLGVDAIGDRYQSDWRTTTELDQHTDAQRAAAGSDHQRARTATTEVRQTARAQAEAIAPSARSPAGARLLVATMDERLEAMQRHLTTAKAQQRLLALRLRQLAGAYRLTAPPPALSAGRIGTPNAPALSHIPALHQRTRQAPAAAKPPTSGAPHLTRDSTPREVAARILWEAHRRGYLRQQAIAILSTAMRESALNPKAVSPNKLWESIFQQDASYSDRGDPNSAIAAFFDRLGMKGGPSSPDIWKSIFWLQQRPGEPSAEAAYAHGRKQYLTEIRSPLQQATQLYTEIVG